MGRQYSAYLGAQRQGIRLKAIEERSKVVGLGNKKIASQSTTVREKMNQSNGGKKKETQGGNHLTTYPCGTVVGDAIMSTQLPLEKQGRVSGLVNS